MRLTRSLCVLATALALSGCYYGGYGHPPGWNHGWHRGYYGGHGGWYDDRGGWRGDWHGGGWH